MLEMTVPAPLRRVAKSGPAAPRKAARGHELLRLAREVEPEQPGLAVELRGIALHEASAERRPADPPVATWWLRAARNVWSTLVAVGEARAERQMLALAERCETLQPQLARDLRAACARRA